MAVITAPMVILGIVEKYIQSFCNGTSILGIRNLGSTQNTEPQPFTGSLVWGTKDYTTVQTVGHRKICVPLKVGRYHSNWWQCSSIFPEDIRLASSRKF